MRAIPVGLGGTLLFAAIVAAQDITVTLDQPDPFEPAFGAVTMEAVVVADEEIERVAFYVDGVVMDERDEPPWEVEVDLGDAIGEHRFQAVAYGISGATGTAAITTPPLPINERVSVELQQLYVTVTDGDRRVLDLGRQHFEIIDERRAQTLVTFARGDIPFTAVVLLDTSKSMEGGKLRAALEGARAFFNGMRPLDEGKLIAFSDRILHVTPFTTFPEVLTAGLGGVRARGGTSINDHLYLAMRQLEERQGRRVVLLLSDGVDSHSVLRMAEVLDRARRSQALIYWLRLPYGGAASARELPRLSTAWRNSEEYRQELELLENTVAESGGRIYLLGSIAEIAPTFQGILEELREQYVLGFYPDQTRQDGSWHRVRVRVSHPGLTVRTRDGYVDF